VQGTLLVEEQAFFDLATTSLPETTSNLGWRLLVRHQAITLESIPAVIEALQTAVESVNQIGAGYMSVESGLVPLLNRFQQEAALLAAPFSLLIIQIGALTLYFLLTTAELVRQQDRREIALMRSRGGFTNQVWALRALEAFLVSAAAVTAAPLIARFGLRQLGAMGVLSGLDSGTIPLRLNATVWGYSIASGLTSWVVLMLTLRPVLRAPLVTAGGAWERPERRAGWQRAFLDVALLVLGGVALWQLRSYGSILVQNQAGRILADPLLLLTPSLLMVAVGSLLLRLFAPAMGLLAAAMARRNGLDTLLAVWHVSRRPVHYSRIALLLALAIGLGWFATGFDATVERSRVDRAGYAVGAEMRLTSVDTLQGRLRTLPEDEYSILGGVKHASVAFRTRFDASTRTTGSLPGELLAVDPASFASAAYWRTDLGVLALPGSGLSAPSAAGRALTPDLARVGLWAAVPGTDPRDLVNRTKLYIRVMDSAGTLANIPLRYSFAEMVTLSNIPDGPYSPAPVKEPTGWVYMVGDLTETGRPLHEPLYLRSIHWTYRSPTSGGGQGILTLAELTLYDQTLVSHSVPWLATTAGWQFQHDGLSVATGNVVTRPSRKKAELATTVSWSQTGRTASMGLILDASPAGTLPAIVSSSFLQGNGITGRVPFFVNLMNTRLRFQVVGVMDYYPSLYADARPFLVTDRDLLLYALNLLPSAAVYPNEIWLQLEDPNSAAAVLEALNRPGDGYAVKDVLQARDLQRQMQNNPLTIGLTGLFFIAFAVALILSAVSLLSYVSLTAQARRVEFSILQSLGHSAQRLLLSLALEQSLVLGTAAGLGAVLGAMLSGQILPFLSVTEGGQLIVPPFRIMTGTDLLARYALIMLAVFAVLLLASLWLLRSLPLARTLRLGDE
jgi:hypothetical protein